METSVCCFFFTRVFSCDVLDKQMSARNNPASLLFILRVDCNFVFFCANYVTFQASRTHAFQKAKGDDKTHVLSILTGMCPKQLGVRWSSEGPPRDLLMSSGREPSGRPWGGRTTAQPPISGRVVQIDSREALQRGREYSNKSDIPMYFRLL